MWKHSVLCTHVTACISAGGSVTHVWLIQDLYHQQHLSQPENRVLTLWLGDILMPCVLRKKHAQAKVAGTRRLEGRWCCPEPHNPHSAQALGLPQGRWNWQQPPPELNLTTAPCIQIPLRTSCICTLEFTYLHRRINPSTHTWSFTQSTPGFSGTVIYATHFSKFHVLSYPYFPTWNSKVSNFLAATASPLPLPRERRKPGFQKIRIFLTKSPLSVLAASIKQSHFSLTFKTTELINYLMNFVLSCCTSSKPQSIFQVTFFVVISNTQFCAQRFP